MSWRETARPIIAQMLELHKGADEKVIRQALHDAYPFGQRRYHPYKIWLDEIRQQRGTKHPKGLKSQQQKLLEWENLYSSEVQP